MITDLCWIIMLPAQNLCLVDSCLVQETVQSSVHPANSRKADYNEKKKYLYSIFNTYPSNKFINKITV